MSTLLEASRQALEALEEVKSWRSPTRWDGCFGEEITALRQAIEQAQFERVGTPISEYTAKVEQDPKRKAALDRARKQAQPVAKDISAAVLDHCYGPGAVTDDMIERAAKVVQAKLYTAPPNAEQAQPVSIKDVAKKAGINLPANYIPTMDDAIAAGDSVLMNEQAALLRECRLALDSLISQKPTLAGLLCGSTTLGNLKAELGAYRPQGVFGTAPQNQNGFPQRQPLTEWIDPNDKTQKQYLPHIGEPVLFCHGGKTYCGHHNGGSFQNKDGYFNTWECRWMYLPAAHGIKGGA